MRRGGGRIRTRAGLAELRAEEFSNGPKRPARRSRPARRITEEISRPDARILRVPGPANGVLYRQEDVAALMDVKVSTVRSWVARGQKGVRLQTLALPRGRITPAALRDWCWRTMGVKLVFDHETRAS